MPASQLKRLKQSLREQGITGPQKSKKQKKQLAAQPRDRRNDRQAQLQNIRDSFNPFELKPTNSRPEKFASASANGARGSSYKAVLHRPGVTRSAGEEMRRATLLPEMRRRNKVGGLVDRRIGEGDVEMTPEERAMQRYAREKERRSKNRSMFDLEGSDDEGGGFTLTHGGKGIDGLEKDDFGESNSGGSEDENESGGLFKRKRRSSDVDEDEEGGEDSGDESEQPERKKTKKEVMEEVIAKSKYHKYERQKVKEDDDDLREELDKGMDEIYGLLKGIKKAPPPPKQIDQDQMESHGPSINPDRQRLLDGMDRDRADKDYDMRMKQLATDTRAKPSDKSLTAEEKAIKEAQRLKKIEEKRLKRMEGEDVSDEEEAVRTEDATPGGNEDIIDEAADFGFTSSTAQPKKQKSEQLVLDDEDEFDMDDIVASGDEIEDPDDDDLSDGDSSSGGEESAVDGNDGHDEEDEFIKDILGADAVSKAPKTTSANSTELGSRGSLSLTYPCPRSHAELLEAVKDVPSDKLLTVIQRIRALYHPSLSPSNKESMADFACALVEHLSWMTENGQPMSIIEQVIRHLHSLSRTYPTRIGEAFRAQLRAFHERGQPLPKDLVQLTAIGSIYPTSDHFHQVVTPAITVMAKWLGLNTPSLSKPEDARLLANGAFIVALCTNYQRLSKRYISEAVRFTFRALAATKGRSSLAASHIANLVTMADLWKDKSAFNEIFQPSLALLKLHPGAKAAHHHISILVAQARLSRRPLELHHHKKLPLRTSVPKFEENFDPNKHYDPDKERSDSKKLEKEFKRERKGALRELRKDSNFIAREQLKDKRERDAEYEKKYRKLIAEVQNEEGSAGKDYEREKKRRQNGKKGR